MCTINTTIRTDAVVVVGRGGRLVVGTGRRGVGFDAAVRGRSAAAAVTARSTLGAAGAADHVGRLLDGAKRAAGHRQNIGSRRRHHCRALSNIEQTHRHIYIYNTYALTFIESSCCQLLFISL